MGKIRRALGSLASRIETLILPTGDLIPPLHLRWRYFGTVRRVRFLRFVQGTTEELLSRGLQPAHRVLDVGSGLGPLALGLLPFLTRGRYDGFDVHAEAVEWCTRSITSRHPHFRFQHADLASTTYNPRGTLRAMDFRFPYEDEAFDFAFLGSVCTHLLVEEVAHYLGELARVLRPGGKCVVSFYLLNADSLAGIAAGTSFLPFRHELAGSRVVDLCNPALAIAHPEEVVKDMYAKNGLRIEEPIHRGRWWAGIAHQQEVVTALKPARVSVSVAGKEAVPGFPEEERLPPGIEGI